jgi:uncharacterized protein
MSVFTLEERNRTDLPDVCRNVIRGYKDDGKFDISAITADKQEYTSVYLLMTQDCNLSCPYCYQPGQFRQKGAEISKRVIDDTVGFVFQHFDEAKVKFSIFGGEPFLNFGMIKYLLETYPMFHYVVTTNGLCLIDDKSIRDWIIKHKYHLKVSVSIASLKARFGKYYLEAAKPALDIVQHNGGDVHYVIDDPDEPGVFEEIKYLFEYPVPVVRISAARHWDLIKDKNEAYKALFKRLADYIYFAGEPQFGRSQWDIALKNNIYRKLKGLPLKQVPPTFCGCGYLYLAVNHKGEIYPCDFFANFPEFKIGDIYAGFNETALFFKKMGDWLDELYEDCRSCEVCAEADIRLCPRAMCLAENYIVTGNPLKPAANHCWANRVEYANFEYIAKKAIALGIDELYYRGK